MIGLRWHHGLLKGPGQALATALVASTLTIIPLQSDPALAASAGSGECSQEYTTVGGSGTVSVTSSGGVCYLAFRNTSGTGSNAVFDWVRPSNVSHVDILVVGGGGGGGSRHQGGGGAGRFVESTDYRVSDGSPMTVTVGHGGAGGDGVTLNGSKGGLSSFLLSGYGISAPGGGGGSNGTGGSSGGTGTAGPIAPETGTLNTLLGEASSGTNSGNIGARGARESDTGDDATVDYWAGGGGGGAGSAGGRPTVNNVQLEGSSEFPPQTTASTTRGGDGGNGRSLSWLPSDVAVDLGVGQTSSGSVFFAGGGGGGIGNDGAAGGGGGIGGGGQGTKIAQTPGNATSHTGGGGGASGYDDIDRSPTNFTNGSTNPPGGDGGSGVVIISYMFALDAPTSLVAVQSNSHAVVNLSWTAPSNTGNSAITDYLIDYKPAGGSWTSYSDAVSTATTATLTLPQQCIAFDFRVSAYNGRLTSAPTNTASAVPVWGTFATLSGVAISSTNSECVVKFTSTASNSWSPPVGTEKVRALIVGGGGGGGAHVGGGGGGGGVIDTVTSVTPGNTYSVIVGAGGAGGALKVVGCVNSDAADDTSCGYPAKSDASKNGATSSFAALQALGGGRGGHWDYIAPNPGGSGGGGSHQLYFSTGNSITSGLASGATFGGFLQGYAGGGSSGSASNGYPTGGGGGAGGPGIAAGVSASGNGGPGRLTSISGISEIFAGGGGGGKHDAVNGYGAGGTGGGGSGNSGNSRINSQNGLANTGGGGGGGGASSAELSAGGNGGSGLVILRQLNVQPTVILNQPVDSSAQPGNTTTFQVTASSNGVLGYQWQESNDGTTWVNINFATSPSYTTAALFISDNSKKYRVIVSGTLNGQTSIVTSSEATVTVAGITLASGTLCENMVGYETGATVSPTADGGCLLKFTTAGENSWTVPANVSSIQVLAVGAGGGGAGGRGGSWYGGGGGGGGGASQLSSLTVTTSQVIPLLVGSAGVAGGNGASGTGGGLSSFSVSSVVVLGGSGGNVSAAVGTGGTGGGGAAGNSSAAAGSSGGKGADGLASQTYQRPTAGSAASTKTLGGEIFCLGGGGGGGNRGVDGNSSYYYQAAGGSCSTVGLTSGGKGRYYNGSSYLGAFSGTANTGGGGGGGSYTSGGGSSGANGAAGLIAIYFVPGAGAVTLTQPAAMSYSSAATTPITLAKDSGGAASWTTSNTSICTVSGNNSSATVVIGGSGICSVTVVVAAAGGFSTGSAQVSFRIDKVDQSVPTWDSATATVAYQGSVDLYEKLASPSGTGYRFTASGTGCAVTGFILTVGNAGSSCSVFPVASSTAIYNEATGTAMIVSVTKISQSDLVITSGTSMNVNQTFTISGAGGSGLGALSYHVSSAGLTGCQILDASTGVITSVTAAGVCVVYAQRAASTNFDAITSSNVAITVNKISQVLSWVSQPQAQYLPGNTYAVEATASSQLSLAYAVTSGLCTINSNLVTFTGSGNCVIEASQPGSPAYLAAVTISQVVSVGKINQTMTFSALANKSWGSLAFALSATASSGLAIVYGKNLQTTNNACDVLISGVVTIKNVGTCAIDATQAGNASYTSVSVTRVFEVTANPAGTPFIGSISFGDRTLNASFFTPSYLGGGTVSAYELRAYDPAGNLVSSNTGCIANPGPTQSCSVIGLENGQPYVLRVAAINQAGLGALSASSSEITPAANPEAAGNLIAIEGNGTLTIQWTQPTSLGGGNFDQYRIFWRAPGESYQSNGSPGATLGSLTSTSYVITGLQNGVAYDVKITTVTTVNTLELQANTAEVRQTPFTVPDAPASIVAIDNKTSLVVAWQQPAFDGGNTIDQYVVQKDGITVCTITSVSSTSCEIAKPSAGNTSTIEVRAGNEAGLSAPIQTTFAVAALVTSAGTGGFGQLPSVTPSVIKPVISQVSVSGEVRANDLIRLVGTDMNLVERVFIDGFAASFFINSASLITVRIPSGVNPGDVVIRLEGSFGSQTFSNLFEVTANTLPENSKVTIGTFLGFAAVYTKNYEGSRLSMKIGNKWRVVPSLSKDYTYNLTKIGKGKVVTVMVYIDRKLVSVKQVTVR